MDDQNIKQPVISPVLKVTSNMDSYTFKLPRLIPFIILLIPLTLAILLIYAYIATKNESPTTSAGIGTLVLIIIFSLLTFGIVAVYYILPKITIANNILIQRNGFGHSSNPVNMTMLTSLKVKRGYVGIYVGMPARVWLIKLVDNNDHHTTIATGRWNNETLLKQLVVSYSKSNNLKVDDTTRSFLNT